MSPAGLQRGTPLSLVEALHARFREQAAHTEVAALTIGLGYTAVETARGDVGLGYTMAERSVGCTRTRRYRDFDGEPVTELLDRLLSDDSLERSIGLAAVNALNRRRALSLPVDDAVDPAVVGGLKVRPGACVAMIGFFGPVVRRLETLGAQVDVLDRDRGMGEEQRFMETLDSWPQVVIVTATTILTGSLERLLCRVGDAAEVLVLGPSTPMVPSAWHGRRVGMLGGMVPLENDRVVATVRQGGGTPEISRYCRKVFCPVRPGAEA
ncbi:MAG: DUF364 domain-containing protein [Thermoleophilia bacterium]|nr:DUF364 domain-containing protein [Thermoleophilia bacterium]